MTDTPKRPRHLMDPANPVRMVNDHSLTRVQRTVMSVLAGTTILHLAVGLVIAAVMIDEDKTPARVGLNIIAGAFGVVAVAAARLIHQRNPLTPWLVVGLLPAAVGLFLVLR